jgi:hypothetical protein
LSAIPVYTCLSNMVPPPVAAWLNRAHSDAVTDASGVKVAIVVYWLVVADCDPVGRVLSVAYCVVYSVCSAVSPAAAAVVPEPKRRRSCRP